MGKHTIENNCEILFEYLRSTLYDKEPKEVQIDELDQEFQKLGMGIAYMQQQIKELLQYSASISLGDLNAKQPSRDNFLCSNLKNLQSNLKHLTWQAKQVAKGDYSQRVMYLGEFSDAFNEMIHQLKERDAAIKRRTRLTEEYNRFFLEMSRKREEWILIVSEDSRKKLFDNRQDENNENEQAEQCKEFVKKISESQEFDDSSQLEISGQYGKYYEISAYHMEWDGEKAVAFVINDITKERQHSNDLSEYAYNDALTGIKNRRFFDEYTNQKGFENNWNVFCYIDLDGLKYVNDNFGHKEGDAYIRSFIEHIKKFFRTTDVFIRLGGDEFCVFYQNFSAQQLKDKLEMVRDTYIKNNDKEYPVSFSYGLIENSNKGLSFEEIVKQADEEMYQYKKKNKKERK